MTLNTEAQHYQEGDFLDYTPGSAVVAGQLVSIGKKAAMCATAIAASVKGAAQVKKIVKVRAAAVTGSKGDMVGWDENGNPYGGTAGTGAATTTLSDADILLGKLTEDLTATDGVAYVELNDGSVVDSTKTMIFVSKNGSDSFGDGSLARPYATIAAALAAVTTSRKAIIVLPGEYEEAASLTWPSISGVSLNGLVGHQDGATIIGTSGQTQVIQIDPTVQTATFEATISNLTISCPDGVRGITFNNTNVGRKINLYLFNVAFENDTETDRAISVVHTTAGNAMRVYASGQRTIIEGLVYIEPKNVDDRFIFDNFQFDGGVQFGTTNIASSSVFKDCIMKDNGGAGGHDNQLLAVFGCVSLTGTTYAAAALADFAANAAETILSYS